MKEGVWGTGSGRYAGVSDVRPAGDELPEEANEARIVVTLGESVSDGGGFDGVRKIGSLFQDGFGLGAGGTGGRDEAGVKLVVADAVLKT